MRHHHNTVLSHLCELADQLVGQSDRIGHIFRRLVGGITEHHSLITGTLFHRVLAFYTSIDIGALFVNGTQYAASISTGAAAKQQPKTVGSP